MRTKAVLVLLGALAIASCTASPAPVPPDVRTPPIASTKPSSPAALEPSATADAGDAGPAEGAPKVAVITPEEAEKILFVAPIAAPNPCTDADAGARVRCLIALRYASEAAAKDLAIGLFARTGDV